MKAKKMMGKSIQKIVIVLGMLLYAAILVNAMPQQRFPEDQGVMEGRTVLVQDLETKMEYSATILAIGRTVQGQCDDTDNGFKPNDIS